MSTANCPETPRQKMIGMMYLFYTAMLALNVSKSILHAFVVVNSGLVMTNENFAAKNEFMYNALEQAKGNDPVKVAPFYEAAMKAKKIAKEMKAYIKDLKMEMYLKLGIPKDSLPTMTVEKLEKVGKLDNYDIPTHMMVGTGDTGGRGCPTCEAEKLKNKLEEFRENLIKIIRNPKVNIPLKEKLIKGLGDLGIDTRDQKGKMDKPEERTWEMSHFYHMPAAAALTVFTQLENQVENAEGVIVNLLLQNIGAQDFKFDTLAAKVIPKSNYVISGDKYEAELFVAAFSTTSDPIILVGDDYDTTKGELVGKIDTVPVTRGVGHYVVPATSLGPKHYAAIIKVKDPVTGKYTKEYPLVSSDGKYGTDYLVAKPSAVISPTKMNVLYIGVDNPIEVSVSGFSADQVHPRISQGSLRKKGGSKYIARVRKTGKAYISVSVTDDQGNARSMGRQEFRVKRVPDPIPTVAGKRGGGIKKSILLAQSGVKADLKNFDFDLKFRVVSFTVSATIGGFEKSKKTTGARFSSAQLALMKKVRPGGKVYIENVKAKGPDGKIRNIGAIAFRLK